MLAPPGVVIIPLGGCGVSSRMLAPPSFRSSLSSLAGTSVRLRSRVELFEQDREVILHADYAEVCVKPRICGDRLCWWGLLVDSSA
jgi:hypothetical protein